MTRIGLKELRQNVSKFADKVKKGEEFVVMRKSQPLFKIAPIDAGGWEEVIDFTKLRKGGVDIEELLTRL